MIRSTLPFTISGMRVLDSACTNFALTPRSLAISLARSTSKPSGWPVSLLMEPIGGKSYLVPTTISPFCLTLSRSESAARASGTAARATARATRASTSLRMGSILWVGEPWEGSSLPLQGDAVERTILWLFGQRRVPMARTAPKLADAYTDALPASRALSERAQKLFPDAVTHDNRRMQPFPLYVDRAEGAFKWDVDGHRYIDYWMGHGALLFGHNPPMVRDAVREQANRGTHYGACHPKEVEWGEWVRRLVPSAERVRFTASGTEATHMAVRLARAFTGRKHVVKFAGHF